MDSQDEFDDILKNKLDSQDFPFDESNWEKASDMIDASRNSLRDKLDAEEFPFDESNWEKASEMIDASRNGLRDKLDAEEFAFDEANWEKMRAMIDASRRERRPVIFYLAAAGLLLLLCISGYFFLSSGDDTTATIAEHKTANEAAKAEQTTSELKANESENSNGTDNTNARLSEKANEISSENKAALAANENDPSAASNESNKTSSEAPTTQKASSVKSSAGSTSKSNASKKTAAEITASENENGTAAALPSAGSSRNQNSGKQANKPNSKQQNGLMSNDENGKSAGNKGATSEEQDNNTQLPATASHNNDPAAQPVKDETTPSVTAPENSTPSIASATSSASPDSLAKPVIALAAKVDTAAPVIQDSKFRTEKDPVNFIYAEAGTNYLLGWRNMNEKDANGFNPVIGLHFYHLFKNKIGFTVGSQYNCVGNLSYSSHTSTVTHYDFGKVDDVTIITPTKIHYISGVVKVNYAFRKNNVFGIGCNVSYLLNVDNKVETYNQRDNTISQVQISKTSGYIDGFTSYDLQATVSYRRMIYKDLGANIEFFYGLTDVKTNGFFNTSFFERNSGMKLTLTYNIFKK